ncbi:hypothetical protein, variant [Puccinia triticina 1-1 BBBD Race 1]|nr:hypothetical protein, variant [Puccinia triticina 1-1 BBBD Race 1]
MNFSTSMNAFIMMVAIVCVGLVNGKRGKDTAQRFGCPHEMVYGHCRWIDVDDNDYITWNVARAPRYGPGYSCRSVDTAYCCTDLNETHSVQGNGIKAVNNVAQFVNSDQCVAAKTHYP